MQQNPYLLGLPFHFLSAAFILYVLNTHLGNKQGILIIKAAALLSLSKCLHAKF